MHIIIIINKACTDHYIWNLESFLRAKFSSIRRMEDFSFLEYSKYCIILMQIKSIYGRKISIIIWIKPMTNPIYLAQAKPIATPPVNATRKICKLLIFGPCSSPIKFEYHFLAFCWFFFIASSAWSSLRSTKRSAWNRNPSVRLERIKHNWIMRIWKSLFETIKERSLFQIICDHSEILNWRKDKELL